MENINYEEIGKKLIEIFDQIGDVGFETNEITFFSSEDVNKGGDSVCTTRLHPAIESLLNLYVSYRKPSVIQGMYTTRKPDADEEALLTNFIGKCDCLACSGTSAKEDVASATVNVSSTDGVTVNDNSTDPYFKRNSVLDTTNQD